MKKRSVFITAVGLFLVLNVQAQIPQGYTKGSVLLADGNSMTGYVQDNMKKGATVIFLNDKGEDKKLYNSSEINGVTIDGIHYISVKGDFFKTVCSGKICFLQKASHASGKKIYNGSEAIVIPGTEGKIGDYFIYTNNQLTHITKKTVDAFIAEQLASCAAATEKAKSINGDMAALADAIVIYNDLNK